MTRAGTKDIAAKMVAHYMRHVLDGNLTPVEACEKIIASFNRLLDNLMDEYMMEFTDKDDIG